MSLLNDPHSRPELPAPATSGRQYWRSLEHLEKTPQFEAFLEREFPQGASEMLSPFSRRAFLNLMGASVALAGGLTGCRRPKELIMPYTHRPEDLQPGIMQHYATAMERGGQTMGLVLESHEGRPTKVEGNPDFPANQGGLDAMSQGSILELYDPDRSQGPLKAGKPVAALPEESIKAFDAFLNDLSAKMLAARGAGLAILSERGSSPSLRELKTRVEAALPQATWHVWEPVNDDNAIEGARLAFGRPLATRYDFEKADAIVALECDFLSTGADHLLNARKFARRRRREAGESEPNRLYAIEGYFSLTGAMADHRLRLAPSQVAQVAKALGAALGAGGAAEAVPGVDEKWLAAVVKDLQSKKGKALVVPGPSLPPAIHALAHQINAAIGADCAQYFEPLDADLQPAGASLKQLTDLLDGGKVQTLLMFGGNPVYDAPADLNFATAMAKAPVSVHLSLYANETSKKASWHYPRAHQFESWGDLQSIDGTIGMVQPMIAPLFDGRTDAEFLAQLAGFKARSGYEIVRGFHQKAQAPAQFDPVWRKMLHDGMIASKTSAASAAPNAGAISAAVGAHKAAPAPSKDSIELLLLPDAKLYDGRYANNGWLMETPDPASKVTWDNCAYMSMGTAKALGVSIATRGQAHPEIISIDAAGAKVELPIWILPGMADWTIALHLGYGRTEAGRVGNGVGKDVYPLRKLDALHTVGAAKIAKTGKTEAIACVQDHWAMEGRELIREEEFGVPLEVREKKEETVRLWKAPQSYDKGPQWGMTIDLSSCIGCNACMVACQAENNVPIVGKKHVLEGREMHWIRIDRYFAVDKAEEAAHKSEIEAESLADPGFALDSAEMVFQPMPCQQCENAPCEQVCPVGATTHSPEGLNEMVYNRCIGTRYCSNNCPYKVRRFNFFNYHEPADTITAAAGLPTNNPLYTGLEKRDQTLLHMAANPNVTVRSRGVMEKCSFCVQRINKARWDSKLDGTRVIKDGAVVTACQQTCPTQAITFGDIRDEKSKVFAKKNLPGNYTILDEELDTKPRTSYHTRLRNPNRELMA